MRLLVYWQTQAIKSRRPISRMVASFRTHFLSAVSLSSGFQFLVWLTVTGKSLDLVQQSYHPTNQFSLLGRCSSWGAIIQIGQVGNMGLRELEPSKWVGRFVKRNGNTCTICKLSYNTRSEKGNLHSWNVSFMEWKEELGCWIKTDATR